MYRSNRHTLYSIAMALVWIATGFRSQCDAFTAQHVSHFSGRRSTVGRGEDKPLSLGIEPLQEAWASYNVALEESPLLVKSLSASVILGAADLAGQAIEAGRSEDDVESGGIDFARFARFAVFGLVLQAPWNHFYYLMLDGAIPPTDDPLSTTNMAKVVIDQFVQAPIFTVLIFVFLGILEGKQFEAIQKQLQADYKDTILANWKLWLPATVVNIGFVPPILRVLFLNGVFFFWSIYLSLVLNKTEEA